MDFNFIVCINNIEPFFSRKKINNEQSLFLLLTCKTIVGDGGKSMKVKRVSVSPRV